MRMAEFKIKYKPPAVQQYTSVNLICIFPDGKRFFTPNSSKLNNKQSSKILKIISLHS